MNTFIEVHLAFMKKETVMIVVNDIGDEEGKKKRNRRRTTTRWIYRSLNSVERSHAFSVTRII